MIGNNDIFDDEELLAIANDDNDESSSSSSCHSSTESEDEENESSSRSRLPSPSPSLKGGGDDGNTNHQSGIDVVSGSETTLANNIQQTKQTKQTGETSPSNTQTASAPKGEDQENSASSSSSGSSSSDDNDDGFLESWFETEKQTLAAAQNTSLGVDMDEDQHSDTPIEEIDDDGENNEHNDKHSDTQIEKVANGKKEIIDHGNSKNEISLGDSVLQWISSATKSASSSSSNNLCGGVVALQHTTEDHEDDAANISHSHTSTTLRLRTTTTTTPTVNLRKRSRSGNDTTTAKAIIEEVALSSSLSSGSSTSKKMANKNKKCGRVVITQNVSDAERLSTPGAMVDCLARYDSHKGCYVLEMVDLLVDKIEPMSSSGAISRDEQKMSRHGKATATTTLAITGTPTEKKYVNRSSSSEMMSDPRLVARRAEDQLKKLKRGKGRLGSTANKKKKQKRKTG